MMRDQEKRFSQVMDEKLTEVRIDMSQMMDEKLTEIRADMSQMMDEKLVVQRKEVMSDVVTLMDTDFKPKFDLLAEDLCIIHEKLASLETKLDILDTKVGAHEIKLKVIN